MNRETYDLNENTNTTLSELIRGKQVNRAERKSEIVFAYLKQVCNIYLDNQCAGGGI